MNTEGAGTASLGGRGMGWRPDVRRSVGSLHALAPTFGGLVPSTWTWLAERAPIWDQLTVNDCVSFAKAECLWLSDVFAGRKPRLLDIGLDYKLNRLRTDPSGVMVDSGAIPEDAVAASMEWGCALADDQDSDPRVDVTTVNERPFLDQVQSAAGSLLEGFRRVEDHSTTRTYEVQQRLHVLHQPAMFGIDLCEDFARYTGGVYTRRAGARSIGRHMVTICGWAEVDGRTALITLPHYGRTFGVFGKLLIDVETFESPYVSDVYSLAFGAS